MGKSAPSAPDPAATAAAQGAANEAAARVSTKLNNPNTYGPSGAVEHTWNPDDTSSVSTYLSPEQQRIYDNQTKLTGDTSKVALDATGRLGGLLNQSLDTSGLQKFNGGPQSTTALSGAPGGAGQGVTSGIPGAGQGIATTLNGAGQGIQGGVGGAGSGLLFGLPGAGQGVRSSIGGAGQDISSSFTGGGGLARQGTEDYGSQRDQVVQGLLSRSEPQADRDRAAMEARLAAQGFTSGSQGYRDGADELNRARTDARQQAVLAGGQEQSRLFGMDQSRLGFNNAAGVTETNQANAATAARNLAQQQGFGQRAQDAAFGNSAQQQGFQQTTADVAQRNAAQETGFGQQMQAAQFGNQAQAQLFGQISQAAQFGNQAQAQQFGQQQADVAQGNQAQDQRYSQQMQAAAFDNQAAGQSVNQQLALSANQNQTRGAQLAELLQLRAQPINEVSALFGLGNGVQIPGQAQVSPVQVASPDYQGLVSNNYKTNSANVAANNSATVSAVGTAAAAAIAI